MEKSYRISFKMGDRSFEIESNDKSWLESKEKEYLSKIETPKSITTPSAVHKELKKTPVSTGLTINEYYKKYVKANNITTRTDMAVFFIYYLQKIQKIDSVKTGDVQKCFADVSYPNYNKLNYADILNKAKRKALLNYVNNIWSLTITGEDYVLNIITGDEK